MSDTREGLFSAKTDRIELIATVIMSVAAILTAWAAFQSAKWSGEQAIEFSRAGAARTESTRFDTRAGQQASVDVAVFTSWLDAVNTDIEQGRVNPETIIEPVAGTLSGFLFERVREEFRPAFEAWLILWANDRQNAPPTPFDMDEYVLANALEAERLQTEAEQHAATAGQNNQNSDDYVLTVVAFALVLFFGGISSKLISQTNRYITIGIALVMFIGAAITLFSLPKIWPFA
jgi:hypothetical protein